MYTGIQQTRYSAFNIKHYTINAIASAVFALNLNVARAASCPPQIIGTALAGIVCDFDSGTGSSVTVNNGGDVGGIVMNGYNPISPSQIVINAGGVVNNNIGGAGITISNSSLSNGISNQGTINSTSGSGIVITNSSIISGGLANSGLINTANLGISIDHSTINSGIFNSGTINGASGSGIKISNSSIINGGISNSGTIKSGTADVGIAIINHSTVNGGITNSGLIEATGSGNGITMIGTSTINGGISNSGTIKSADHSGIDILNISQVVGDITNSGIISGNQEALSIHNASTLSGNIFNSGMISGANGNGINIYSATTISGGILNSGEVSGGNTGIAVTSTSTISGGILNAGIIQGDINAIHIDSTSNVSDINITGQSARIIGAVDASNTTFNITSGAIFTSEGSFSVNIFNVASNAFFNMANAITATAVNNAGTLATTNQQSIIGNYTQLVGGVFQTGVTNTTQYGHLAVTGVADLSQSGNIYVQINSNSLLHAGGVLSNVISGSTLITPATGFNVTDNSYLWNFTADSNTTGVNLTATIDPKAYNACRGNYCQGAASAIINQVAAGNPLFSPYASLTTESAFQTSASQATPELTNENTQVIQLVARSVMDIIPVKNILHGKLDGDAMLHPADKVWFKPYGGAMTQNENNTVQGFDASVYGFVIGKDIRLTEEWLIGGALAAGKDNMRGKSVLDGQTIKSDVYQGICYASKKLPYNLYFAGQGSIGYGNNNTKRSIPLYASTAEGSYNSWFTNIRTQLGWNIFLANQNLVLTPEMEASYLFINQSSYQESGSAMDLVVNSNNNSSLVLGAYANAAYHLITLSDQQDVTLSGYAGIADNVLNSQTQTTAAFVAGGSNFSTFGVQSDAVVFRGGVGLDITNVTKPLKVSANYDLQTGNNAYSGVGSITISYKI
ncbi:MAG: autotransporter domain-containing protein [Gammaproteobacteria bacterium]|nr:autotransporter domain-containing protein [Gammaproteobacteria bacterium]